MSIYRDLFRALRSLFRTPFFAFATAGVLCLAIGANVVVFSVLDSVLFDPLPFPGGNDLVQIWETDERSDRGPLSLHNVFEIEQNVGTLQSVAGYGYTSFTLLGENGAERVSGMVATGSFFDVLSVPALKGRSFSGVEASPGAERVVVISEGFWKRQFAEDDGVVGRTITLDARPATIVGIVPSNIGGFESIDIWSPLAIDLDETRRGNHYLFGIARMEKSGSTNAVQSELTALGAALEQKFPSTNEDRSFRVVSLRDEWYGEFETSLFVLMATVGLVLLIATSNVAGLMLARTAGRRREVGIRTALGAGRRHLVSQFLSEGVVLAFLGGVSGTLLGRWGLEALKSFIPFRIDATMDLNVVMFALVLTLIVGTLFSLAPLVHTLRSDQVTALRVGGTQAEGTNQLGRRTFVAIQFALSVVLLTAATLLGRSLGDLWSSDPGFDPTETVTMRLALREERFQDPAVLIRTIDATLRGIDAIPSVRSIGAVSDLPFSGSRSSSTFRVVGGGEEYLTADRRQASEGYFEAMGIPILEGRGFTFEDDLSHPRVAVVNEALVNRLWPGESALGKRIVIGSPEEIDLEGQAMEREIVGVIRSIVHDRLGSEPAMEMYLSLGQLPSQRIFLAVRTPEEMQSVVASIREAVRQTNPGVAAFGFSSMEARLERSLLKNKIVASSVGAFAFVALLLSVVGLYGLVSFVVSQRTREFGVRRALGASEASIVRSVLGEGLTLAALGALVGTIASLFLMRFIAGLLYGVSPTDASTIAAVVIVLGLVTLLACAVPAIRAVSIEVTTALREE